MEQRQLYDRERLLQQLGATRKPQDSTEGDGQGKDPQEERKPQNPYLQALEQQKQESDFYKKIAENARKTESLKNDILKGIQQGEDVYQLLYWAVQAVALTTHDNLFYEQAWTSIDAIYGTALAEPGPLQNQIEAARESLEKIRAAIVLEPQEGPRSIMERALAEHEALISRLEEKKENKGGKVERLRYDTDAGEFVPV